MYSLTDPAVIRSIMAQYGLSFKKGFGQNFLLDDAVLEGIIEAAGIDSDTNVIEIGPGIGTLTAYLARYAKKVVSLEIDYHLVEVLEETLCDFSNVTVRRADALKTDFSALIAEEFDGGRVVLAANLPYYITTPIITKLLEAHLPIEGYTFMVQQEVARRFCATPGGKEYGAITLFIQYYTEANLCLTVPASCFMPPPSVNSAVIHLQTRTAPPVTPVDEELFFQVIRASFNQRRKTFANSIANAKVAGAAKEDIQRILTELSLPADVRGERLSMEQFCAVADQLSAGR